MSAPDQVSPDRAVRGPRAHSAVVGPSKPRLLNVLGPGLISGASDDDPTAIATYSQAGAKFGFAFCWAVLLCYPIMVVVQAVSARVGRTTGQGIAANLRAHFPPWLVQTCVGLLLVANVIQIGADLGIMAEIVWHAAGGPRLLYVVLFGGFCVAMQVFLKYTRYVAILKWTTLSLLSYFATLVLVDVPWGAVGRGFVPPLDFGPDHVMTLVAIFGVAISPYIVLWQSAQEAEDQEVKPERDPLVEAPEQAPAAMHRIGLDTVIGMGVACLVGLAIMITTGATLHAEGKTIQSAADAAEALRPAAGSFAFALFGLGIIGTGLLGVPVLAGSVAYAIGEARQWRVGLARQPLEAKAFYGTLAMATLIGAGLNFTPVQPIQALFWSAVINGIIAVPILTMMMLVASRRAVMGEFAIGAGLRIAGWLAVGLMALSVLSLGVVSLAG